MGSGNGAVVPSVLHDGQQSVVFHVEVVLLVVEQLVWLHAFELDPFELKIAGIVLLLAEKGIEVDAVNRMGLLHLLAQEELHSYFWLAFIDLSAKNID